MATKLLTSAARCSSRARGGRVCFLRWSATLSLAILLAGCQLGQSATNNNPPCGPTDSCPSNGSWNYALGPKPVPTAGAVNASGSLVFPRRNALLALDIQSRSVSTLVEFARNASLSTPAPSHDQKQVALTVYTPSSDPKDLGGADLYVVDVTDGANRMLVDHGASGVWLSEPSWSPDGLTLYFTRRAAIMEGDRYRGERVSVERINTDGSGQETVVQNASSPSASADGRYLAYLAPVGGAESAKLWVATFDGQPPREVVVGAQFTQLGSPRFSPRGTQLVFTAVGGPPNTPVGTPTRLGQFQDLFSPPVAYAHGIPWDLWMVNPDGTGLIRLTDVGEDSPFPTWAPDGSAIAFSGENGLYLVDLATGATTIVAQEPAAAVVWVSLA